MSVDVPEAVSAVEDPVAWLAVWRARHGEALHPVQGAVLDGLARRAAGLQGGARERMVQRLQALLDAPQPRFDGKESGVAEDASHSSALPALSALVERLGRMDASPHLRGTHPPHSVGARVASRPHSPPLKSVAAFQGTWSRLRVEQRLRQALAQVPAAAGPLNSAQLVSRALHAMRELSPEYLDAFMSHVDTLLWLERASGLGDTPVRTAAPSRAEPRRRAPGKGARKG